MNRRKEANLFLFIIFCCKNCQYVYKKNTAIITKIEKQKGTPFPRAITVILD